MSSIKLSIVALASSAIASRHGHPYGAHKHSHSYGTGAAYATGSAGLYPYPNANSTAVWGSTGISKPSAPAGYDSSSSGSPDEYSTLYSTAYQTVTVKQNYEAPAASGTGAAPAGYGSSSSVADAVGGEQCTAVTVTHTERVTATITAGENMPSSTAASPVESSSRSSAPGYSAPAYGASSSSEASPVQSSPSSAPAYSVPSSSSSEASPVTTSAPSYESASPSAVLSLSAYGANKQVDNGANAASAYSSASSTKSAAASYSSSSSSGGGKRGLAYNDASLTTCFSGSREISWAYNWGSSSGGLTGDYSFIPTLWGTGSDFVGSWSDNAKAAIEAGSTHLFSFNEPDHTAQANLAPADAATAYAKYMNPFKGQAQLCAPSVTNGGGDMGLTWLKSFLDACTDCQIDCLNIHWYDSAENTDYFKSHMEDAAALAPGKPIYVSEFGATGSDNQVNSFLQEVMPWMDSNSNIAGYAYFMVENGKLVSGSEPSSYGSTYMSYTS